MWWRYNEHPPRALKLGSCIWKEVLSIDGSHPDQFESIRKRLVTAPSTFRREGRFVDISCTLHQGPQWAVSRPPVAAYDKAKVATRLAANGTTPDISPVGARKSHLLTFT
jgi:hypothetical protein